MRNRVVITSSNVISSLGNNEKEILNNIKNNQTSFKTSDFDNELLTCSIKNFNLKEIIGRYKNSRYLNRGAKFTLAAASNAIKDTNIKEDDINNAGLFIGVGPNLDIDGEFPEIKNSKIDFESASALWILNFLPNTAASAISNLLNIHGENFSINTACASSLQAIGEGYRKIKDGYLKVAICGGGDSRLSNGGLLAYKKANALYKNNNDKDQQYIPFSNKRYGFVPGEGAAIIVLENLESAKKRNANILAEIAGYGSSLDGYNMTAPDPSAKYAEIAVKKSIEEAKVNLNEIDVISAHGTGTELNDAMESALIERLYNNKPKVYALKSWIGHLSAACGAVELSIGLIFLKNNILPAIRGLKDVCNKNINFVKETRNFEFNNMLFENFGFGGQNSSLVIKKWKE